MEKEDALALLSGGLDSTVASAMAARDYNMAGALFFDYGQISAERERKAAGEIASFLGARFESLELPWLGNLSGSALTGRGEAERLFKAGSAGAAWVENRNGIFLNIAAAMAVSAGSAVVITGFNLDEAEEFPDNSIEYIAAVNRALAIGEISSIRVESPTASMSKKEIVREGIRLGIPFASLWSCYLGSERMCGRCQSCRRLKSAADGTKAEEIINFEEERN